MQCLLGMGGSSQVLLHRLDLAGLHTACAAIQRFVMLMVPHDNLVRRDC